MTQISFATVVNVEEKIVEVEDFPHQFKDFENVQYF